MPTPFDAIHVRLSARDLEDLEDGEVLVMTPSGKRDVTVVVDAAPPANSDKIETNEQ